MKNLPTALKLLKVFLVFSFAVIFAVSLTQKVYANPDGNRCCSTETDCVPDTNQTCTCKGASDSGCNVDLNFGIGNCVCTSSASTEGCNDPPWGACINYCQTRVLSCSANTPSGYTSWSRLEVRSCDGGNCVDATEDPQSGVYCWPTGAIKTSPSNNTTFLVTQSEDEFLI